MSDVFPDLANLVKADKELRAKDDDPIAAKVRSLRRLNLQFANDGPAYRGASFSIMACAMTAAWTYGQLSGKDGDDFEYWFRRTVDQSFVDGKLVGLDAHVLACAEFVVEQTMAIANEPYAMRATSEWAYSDIGKLCKALAEARRHVSGTGPKPADEHR